MVQLKTKVPGLIVTHCSAHRLSLAASDAAHATPWFAWFEKVLNQVYTFFSRSAVHTAELQDMQRVLDHPKLKLKKASETRWLSLENAVNSLRRCYKSVKAVLENEASEGDATALGLHIQLSKPEFIVNLYFLCDVLDTVGSLSKVFQSNQVNLLGVEHLVEEKLSVLEALQSNIYCGGYMLTVVDQYPEELAAVKETNFDRKAVHYLQELLSSIRNRFPQIRLVTLLGYLHPRHVTEATPALIFELASTLSLNGAHLWNKFVI